MDHAQRNDQRQVQKGEIQGKRIGIYSYKKHGAIYRVAVYSLAVTKIHEHDPECDERKRKWVSIPELAKLIARLPRFLHRTPPAQCQLAS